MAALKAAGYDLSNWTVIEGFNDGNVFTAAVGSFHPNRLGIYDLGGNVWEWCQDEYEPGSASRVLRGGSWINFDRVNLLSSIRISLDPDIRLGNIGFRVVVESGSALGVNGTLTFVLLAFYPLPPAGKQKGFHEFGIVLAWACP